jgi:hypothetical protein
VARADAGRGKVGAAGAAAAAILASACSGIFQHSLPEVPAAYDRIATGPELRVGAAERDITPDVGCYLAGFGIGRTSTGVASPLKVRAMVFGLGERRFAILGIDNLGVMREDSDWIKSGIAGFANGDVFLCASHTHAGPDLIGLWGFYFMSSGRDPAYVAKVRRAAAEAVAEAWHGAAPAVLVHGCERIAARGFVKNAKHPESFDRRVDVVCARAVDDGRPLGTLLHAACHPEVMPRTATLISADYVGALCDGWKEAGLGQAVFVNGALGAMISPIGQARNMDGVRNLGGEMLRLARLALEHAEPMPVDSIEVHRRDVYLPLGTFGITMGRLTSVVERELYSGCARSTVGYLRIGPLRAIAVPGEMEPALAERTRERLGMPDALVFGLCDDELGYLMRVQDARTPEYGYERSMSPTLLTGEIVTAALGASR